MGLRRDPCVGMAAVLWLLLCAPNGVAGQTAGPKPPVDAVGHQYESEIALAVSLGYMTTVDSVGRFKPKEQITAEGFVGCVKKALSISGMPAQPDLTLDNPGAGINKMQAAKLMAGLVLSPEQIARISLLCTCPGEYLADFNDGDAIAPWAGPFVAAAVYKGWMPDQSFLRPDQLISRGYAAALLARAFPKVMEYSGIIVVLPECEFSKTPSVQIVCDDPGFSPHVLYPDPDPAHRPSKPFFQAPGMLSYCATAKAVSADRCLSNPLTVYATSSRTDQYNRCEIAITAADAQKIVDADPWTLLLRTCRVAVVTEKTRPCKPRKPAPDTAPAEEPAPPSAEPSAPVGANDPGGEGKE